MTEHAAEQFREAADLARGLAAKAAEQGDQDKARTWQTAAAQLDEAADATETGLEGPERHP